MSENDTYDVKSIPLTRRKRKVKVQGVTVTVDPSALDDIEILESLYDMKSGENTFEVVPFLRKLFGDEWKHIKDSIRDDNGRVTAERLESFLSEYMEKIIPKS